MNRSYLNQSPELLRAFFGYMETVKGKSPLTVDGYFINLRTFFRFIKQSKGLVDSDAVFEEIDILDLDEKLCAQITLSDVYEYLSFLSSVRGNKAAARSRSCSAIRALFNYLTNKSGILKENPVKELSNPKLRSSLPRFLSLEQSIELLHSIDGKNHGRDYCILMLFLNCGMRLSELVGINYNDILSENRLRIRGKGDKERIIYLNDACIESIKNYQKVRPVEGVIDKEALFISRNRRRMNKRSVQNVVYKYLDQIGLGDDGYSPHKLRHTAATLMYQHGGVDIRVLKDILGHENLGTTQIYTHVSDEQMREAAKANPLAKMK